MSLAETQDALMKWHYYRMHTEARNDAKLRTLTDAQHRTWFRLLCYAAEQPEPGLIDGVPEVLVAAEAADGNIELLRETCNALQALQSVTWKKCNAPGCVEVSFLKFKNRQNTKPSDSRERVRERVAKHRDKKTSVNPPENVTPSNAPCNADVTTNAGAELLAISYQEDPQPPEGAGAPTEAPPPPKPSPNTPAQTEDAVERVAEMFGGDGNMPQTARLLCRDVRAAWVVEAAEIMHGGGKGDDPRYFRGIVRRFQRDGVSDRERASAGPRRPPPKAEPVRAEYLPIANPNPDRNPNVLPKETRK